VTSYLVTSYIASASILRREFAVSILARLSSGCFTDALKDPTALQQHG